MFLFQTNFYFAAAKIPPPSLSLLNACFQIGPMGQERIKNRKFIQELFNRQPLSKEIKLSTVKNKERCFGKEEEEVVEGGKGVS